MPNNKSSVKVSSKPIIDSSDEEDYALKTGRIIPQEVYATDDEGVDDTAALDQDAEDSDPVIVTDVKIIKTRSSSGISKKRQLKDAAVLSDDVDDSTRSSPKKPRVVSGVKVRQSAVDSVVDDKVNVPVLVDVSDNDREDERISLSPLKLGSRKGTGSRSAQSKASDIDVPMADKSTRSKGKQKMPSTSATPKAPARASDALHDDDDSFLNVPSKLAAPLSIRKKTIGNNSNNTNIPAYSLRTPESSPKARRSFKDVVTPSRPFNTVVHASPTTPMMSNGPTLMDDALRYTVPSLPDVCEVTHASLQDPRLVDDYTGLPNLRAGTIISWSSSSSSTSAPMTLVSFSEWTNQCPLMDYDTAYDAISFVRYKNFINPCRISPLDVSIQYVNHEKKKSILQCNFKPAICLTPVFSLDSSLTVASTTGPRNKYISGYFHRQEWQRFEGFACMVFDRRFMVSQIQHEALSFVTLGAFKEKEQVSPSKVPRNPAILSSVSAFPTAFTPSKFKTVLDAYDDVPIFDSRNHIFNFTTDLENISTVLLRFEGEVPYGSFIMAGYTMGHYDNIKDGRPTLTTNILFAIVFAV